MKRLIIPFAILLTAFRASGETPKAGEIPLTCLEYTGEIVCYPAGWKHWPEHRAGKQIAGRQEAFFLNTDYTVIVTLNKDGTAARNWAYAALSIPPMPENTPGGEIAARVLSWPLCPGPGPGGCYQPLTGSVCIFMKYKGPAVGIRMLNPFTHFSMPAGIHIGSVSAPTAWTSINTGRTSKR